LLVVGLTTFALPSEQKTLRGMLLRDATAGGRVFPEWIWGKTGVQGYTYK